MHATSPCSVSLPSSETKLIGYEFELRLAVIPNQRSGIIGAHRKIKEAIDWTACIFHVDDDLSRGAQS